MRYRRKQAIPVIAVKGKVHEWGFNAVEDEVRPKKEESRPAGPCGGPSMNLAQQGGNPPQSFRHFRMAEHCTPDQKSSRAPFH
jgi:hypothetical protein